MQIRKLDKKQLTYEKPYHAIFASEGNTRYRDYRFCLHLAASKIELIQKLFGYT